MASKYRKKFSLPEGFYPVLEGYCREVLRDQPLDVVEFSYLYFKALEDVSIKIELLFLWFMNVRSKTVWFVQGTINQFNYPKKGKNIPPDRGDRPVSVGDDEYGEEEERKDGEDYGEQDEGQEYGEEGQDEQSYYDENGNPVPVGGHDEQYYGDEGGENESNLWKEASRPKRTKALYFQTFIKYLQTINFLP